MEVGRTAINFLDLIISIIDSHQNFGTFREETTTDTLIDESSLCSMAHKLTAFNGCIHKLVQIRTPNPL